MFHKLCLYMLFVSAVTAKSFTVLLDTTTSMEEEIDVIKMNLGSVVHLLNNSSVVENFILIPFNDPDVGPTFDSQTPDGLMTSLNALRVSGGHDCPENSVVGIEMALQVSRPESTVFVFTDAYAKDNSRFSVIENLCHSTHTQVIIFLSGKCVPSGNNLPDVGNIDVYYDIAKACDGTVFRLEEATSLRQAFKFMKEFIKMDWNDIITHESFINYKELPFSLDSFTTDFVVAVNGDNPVLQIIDNDGRTVTTEKIVDTRQSLVFRIVNANPGQYTATIRCQGSASATFYKKKELPFQYGFSTKLPKILKETSLRPLPGHTNYILIIMSQPTIMKLITIKLQMTNGNDTKQLILEENNANKGLYIANSFFEPAKSFKIVVSGQDMSTYQDFTVSTDILKPQQQFDGCKDILRALRVECLWMDASSQRIKPSIEIIKLDSTTIDFGTNLTIACKVTGYPKPNILWEDETGRTLSSEDVLLEIPNVHVTYANIQNFDKNTTIYCKAQNSEGEDLQSVDLLVYRPFTFEMIQIPEDTTVEYSNEGQLYCEVKAYPEANTKWYHNGTLLDSSENKEILLEENTLLIKNMTLETAGEYTCEVANEIESKTFTGLVTVSGLEAPEIEVLNSEILLKPGDWSDIECSIVKGKPIPELTWKYKSDKEYDFTYLPEGVLTNGNQLKIPVVKIEHNGVYRCEAVNLKGQDNRDVTIKVQYAPVVNINQLESTDTLRVREGDTVELKCDVDAVPAARVRWEMSQGDVIMAFDERHTTDDYLTHRFDALWKDSGNYHCSAENDVGKAVKTIKVNVLVSPYIQTPTVETVTVRVGESVRFICNVLYGNPAPSIKWEFTGASTPTVLLRGKTSNTLLLMGVTREQEGSYMCLAENEIGYDSIKMHLKVQQ